MKRFIFFGRLYALLMFALPVQVAAQDPDPFPNHVVPGASAHHKTSVSGNAANSHQVMEVRHRAQDDLKVEIEIVSEQEK